MKKEELLNKLLEYLINENKNVKTQNIPPDYIEKRKLLRALMNIRAPKPVNPDMLKIQDELLSLEQKEHKIINPYNLITVSEKFKSTKTLFSEKLVLWKGDITTIQADAIVNAANSKLLGCFVPLHRCIDNAIHSASGMQLRLECNEIMKRQGFDEPMGCAKITKAYNLPSKYVLHTVGPIIHDTVTEKDCMLLTSCYTSCLRKANEYSDIKTVVFCSISTGEFKFPKDTASKIAVTAVCRYLELNKNRFDRIIFNVFTGEDYAIYEKLFR